MSHFSVFVYPYDVFNTSITAIASRLSDITSRQVVRVDYVHGEGRFYFVHFAQAIPAAFYNLLSAGQTTIITTEGPIRVGLNRSNGLDPNTTDRIMQYMNTASGAYMRNFNTGIVFKWNVARMEWFFSGENPFVVHEIQDVEMEDAFAAPEIVITVPVAVAVVSMDEDLAPLTPLTPLAAIVSQEDDLGPPAPIKLRRSRRIMTQEEMDLRAVLFV